MELLMRGTIACLVSGHKVNRNKVWHDGSDFRTNCVRCDRDLLRDSAHGWRVFEQDRDGAIPRNPHPRAGAQG
jgi:hypothetical protein